MNEYIVFDNPYYLQINKNHIVSIKLHGENVHIATSDGASHRINKREYSYEQVCAMLAPSAKAATPKSPSKAKAKKEVDNG